MSYRDDLKSAVPVPWYETPSNGALTGELGGLHDDENDLDRAAVKMRWTAGARMLEVSAEVGASVVPMAGDTERLRRIGAGYALPWYDGETAEQYQARLDEAFPAYELMGTSEAIVREIRAFGVPDVEVWEEWMSTGQTGKRYADEMVIVLGPNFGSLGWGPLKLGSCKLGAAVLGIGGMTHAQAVLLVKIIRRRKDATSKPIAIVYRFGDFPVLGMGVKLGACKLGGSDGSGYARQPVGECAALGKNTLGPWFKLGTHYKV